LPITPTISCQEHPLLQRCLRGDRRGGRL